MAVVFSLIFSILPTILVRANGAGMGATILTYLCAVVFSFIGCKIGKFIRNFADPLFVSSDSVLGLAMEKFNALYGLQISGFVIGLFLAFTLINGRISHNQKFTKIKGKEKSALVKGDWISVKGGQYNLTQFPEFYGVLNDENCIVNVHDFKLSKTPVTPALWSIFSGKNEVETRIIEGGIYFSCDDYHYGLPHVIKLCNFLSIQNKLKPCYSFNGSTNYEEWSKMNNYIDFLDLVSCDFSANGYRLPTESEWVIAMNSDNEFEFTNGGEWLWNYFTRDCTEYERDITGPKQSDYGKEFPFENDNSFPRLWRTRKMRFNNEVNLAYIKENYPDLEENFDRHIYVRLCQTVSKK